MTKTSKLILKISGMLLGWLLLLLLFNVKTAHALTLNPDPGSGVPAGVRNSLIGCDQGSQSPAFVQWISQSGDPANVAPPLVNYGTASVSLQFNLAGAVCFSNSAVDRTHLSFTGTTPPAPQITGLVGSTPLELYWDGSYNSVGAYRFSAQSFNFAPTGGFTASGDYVVTINTKMINHFLSGSYTYLCVYNGANPISTTGIDVYGPCPTNVLNFTVHVDVIPPGSIQGQRVDIATGAPLASGSFSATNGLVSLDGGGAATCANPQTTNTTFCQPFFFPTVLAGTHALSAQPFVTVGADTYNLVGYSMCVGVTTCHGTYKTDWDSGTSNQKTVSVPGGNFLDFYWHYKKVTAVSCSGPGSGIINQAVSFTATGGSGTYGWSAPGGSPSGGITIGANPFSTTYNTPGNYVVTVTSNTVSDTCNIRITRPPTYPYLRVYNGDVMVGTGFKTSCTQNSGAGIVAYDVSSTPGAGAGTAIAAFALNTVHRFSTANSHPSTANPAPHSGLTFADKLTGASNYGGSFGYAPCIKDYYKQATTTPGAVNWTSNTFPATQGATTVVNDGAKLIYYHTGNLTITGNVVYANAGIGWGVASDIPAFYIIVSGNIKIASNVTQLDGVYIAQGVPQGGFIFTCTQSNGTFFDPSNIGNSCSQGLTFNGAVLANAIRLLRTNGNYLTSSPNEAHSNQNIAETFVYTPEVWLNSPFAPTAPYQSITNLPPVL